MLDPREVDAAAAGAREALPPATPRKLDCAKERASGERDCAAAPGTVAGGEYRYVPSCRVPVKAGYGKAVEGTSEA
jgi:hypothetical protein